MPVQLSKRIDGGGHLGLWKIVESEQFFHGKLELFPSEIQLLSKIKGQGKRIQYLASRWLLHLMSNRGKRSPCLKDEFGKPYLKGSDYHISLSHSSELVAVAASEKSIGVDIQLIVPKILRIKHKFCSDFELSSKFQIPEMIQLHTIWGAKESMYKAYGKKEVDFKQHMKVRWDKYEEGILSGTGFFEKDDYKRTFELVAENVRDYILVYATTDN